jgi:LmbE family N-acetylglucosaminyl deacetylase
VNKMNILCLAAHFDDVEVGCGGTLAKWASQGHNVHTMTMTGSGYANETGNIIRDSGEATLEGKAAARVLGINQYTNHSEFKVFELNNKDEVRREILKAIKGLNIDTILFHWDGDIHADHRGLSEAAGMCSRHLPRILTYRSNFYDGTRPFNPVCYVDISETFDKKIESIKCYKTEFARAGKEWLQYVENENSIYGLKVGVRYAEGFESIRFLL